MYWISVVFRIGILVYVILVYSFLMKFNFHAVNVTVWLL